MTNEAATKLGPEAENRRWDTYVTRLLYEMAVVP